MDVIGFVIEYGLWISILLLFWKAQPIQQIVVFIGCILLYCALVYVGTNVVEVLWKTSLLTMCCVYLLYLDNELDLWTISGVVVGVWCIIESGMEFEGGWKLIVMYLLGGGIWGWVTYIVLKNVHNERVLHNELALHKHLAV